MLYLTEGDYINAGLSALSIIPGADAFTKTGKASKVLGNGIVESGLKHLNNVADRIKKLVKKADDAIDLEKHLPKKLLTEEAEAFAKKADKVVDDGVEDAAKAIKSGINSLADMMSPEEAARYKAYFVKDAPDMVLSGTKELEGIHVHYNKLKGVEEVQPWKAYYDDYGRLVARTDYNAGNKAAGIPDVHYHLYEWGKGFADWKSPHEYASHLEGEFTWTTKR